MNTYPVEVIYLGFFLPALFSLTFFIEGVYKIHKHEDGLITIGLGFIFLIGLGVIYMYIMPK